ncbi:hypothetical protein [Mycobacterium sp.]|uniref:hypothetical protein n=1 Tax=Mycobacterium sp. TaxID=1785 RepID=UPI002B84D677|nr:hypothetical protein [Mycobacterium sp.]HTY35400.1 hypothetical protein [Mycobacterium sp.]
MRSPLAAVAPVTSLPTPRGRCLHCDRRILTRHYRILIDRHEGPLILHERCVHPIRITRRGRLIADLAGAAFLTPVVIAAIWLAWAAWGNQ